METLKYKDLLQRYVQKQLQTKNELSFLEEQDLLEMGFSRFLINRWKQQYHKVGIEILPCPKDELRRRNQKESEANQKFKEYYDYPTKELRDNLIVDLLWLADEMTQKFAKLSGLETSDLVSYAYEGLLKAMKTSQKYGFCAIAREEIQKL